ncbi:uncharacterized protein Gasu_38340 [Galdieria sulphuraria]|uniref:Uncharacterized protein n=1 Tax=Galdieria sulphuraria TaxID=130081 RepID=M2XYQ6_GALSU|nr:uncharacterized protein Gasu_38340 [Galdieria sulphuraria]EME28624.1 hypothetical protein Gasu_38340 [Galdieria sulphuraria]|eukprot:XP_005705144.1 hypothetical protein Gasu_38340 [Galdieria sulphuraria]
MCLKRYVSSKSDKVGTGIDGVSERHLFQIVFGPYIVEEEAVFAFSRVLLICFFSNTLKVILLKIVVVVAVKSEKETSHFLQTACVWIVYKVALKDIHEGWVELLQYYTSANIDAVVSD